MPGGSHRREHITTEEACANSHVVRGHDKYSANVVLFGPVLRVRSSQRVN